MKKHYRLRTLLGIITVLCLFLAVRNHVRRIQLLAQEHHYSALKEGYRAIALRRASPERQAFEIAHPIWERSIQQAALADHYMHISKRPWLLLFSRPVLPDLKELPADDIELRAWWQERIATHVKRNGLESNWGSYSDSFVSERDLSFLRVRPASFNRFLALSHPELFADQSELLPDYQN